MKTLKIAGICAFCAQAAAVFLLLAFSFLLSNAEDPEKHLFLLSVLTAAVVSLSGGWAAAGFDKDRPLLCGLLAGAAAAVLSLAMSAIPGGQKPVWQSLLLAGVTVGGFALSAFLCGKRRDGSGRNRRKRALRKRKYM